MSERAPEQDTAPATGRNVDVELGDETQALLINGDVEAAKARHSGRPAGRSDVDNDRVTGDLGGTGDEQAGGAG